MKEKRVDIKLNDGILRIIAIEAANQVLVEDNFQLIVLKQL